MGANFDDFLSQLGRQTTSQIRKEQSRGSLPYHGEKRVELRESNERKGGRNEPPATKKPESAPPAQKPIKEEKISRHLTEDFKIQALEYGNVIVKTVRKGFNTEEERKKVFESIRRAIDFYLEENTSYTPQKTNFNQNYSQEALNTWNEVNNNEKTTQQRTETINRDLNFRTVKNEKGKETIDVSSISESDIADIKALAGVSAEIKKNKEMKEFEKEMSTQKVELSEEEKKIIHEAYQDV